MKNYILRVKLNNGTFTDMSFRAISLGIAINIAESQFGKGSFLGCIGESSI
jgi:hypothetical protein